MERGKHVITTDGASAWDPNLPSASYPRSLVMYLRGYRGGTDEARVVLLKGAMESVIREIDREGA